MMMKRRGRWEIEGAGCEMVKGKREGRKRWEVKFARRYRVTRIRQFLRARRKWKTRFAFLLTERSTTRKYLRLPVGKEINTPALPGTK
jgi:hypothetical protein